MSELIKGWAQWFRDRPDREHEITLNRFFISIAILVFTLFFMPVGDTALAARAISVVYLVAATLLLGHLLYEPGISNARRIIAMVVDLVLLSCGLAIGQDAVAILYPFYYWIILGNGFRYGEAYLYSATAIGTAGFGVVVLLSPYWQSQPLLSGGLLAGIVILPLYAATLIRSLSRAKEAAEQANRAKSAFLTSVSHELRTPLNAIMGSTDLLRDTTLRRDQRDMVDTIQTASNALLSQINDLLDLSSIESGQIALQIAPFDPLELVGSVKNVGAVQALAKGVQFHLFATGRTPTRLEADARRVREVLINLVGNAVKFTTQGSVTLSIDCVFDGGSPFLVLEVSDTGIGMSPAEQAVIFQRFTQANSTILNRFGGTGLGLAIVRELVDLQKGRIEVSSRSGEGSAFTVRLPVRLMAEDEPMGSLLTETRVVLLDPLGTVPPETMDDLAATVGAVARATSVDEAMTRIILPAADEIRHTVVLIAGVLHAWPEPEDLERTVTELRTATPAGIFGFDRDTDGFPPIALRRLLTSVVDHTQIADGLSHAMRLTGLDQQSAAGSPAAITRRERGLRILLADDNRVNQKVISRILEAGGHFVKLAVDGQEALDAMDAGGLEFVLMDLNMPGMDGLEATKLYRMMSLDRPHLPIVGLTADATQSAADRAAEAGMDACLTKPVNGPVLLDRIDALYAEYGQPGERQPFRPVVVPDTPPVTQAASAPDADAHVDTAMLKNLETLGGPAFVAAVISDFLTDGSQLLLELREVAATGDVAGYAEKAHALQSGAGNIGVLQVAEFCRSWRPRSSEDLMENGPSVVERIEREFETARSILLRQHARRPLLISDRDAGA
ncbi:sensor histidine kinase [Aureimonas frigidaquae]|uniref:Sensory/regulatory protein RpfC n=1 Tax=Aureimonas frigidaquae TaxID=424757 RepID=A0A0P0Z3A3_9HYPH|nr:sensor histidine kinase [Aureimonas frigidaquae]BAT28371.1 ATPase/histidine kinase/DNA gyrase B/HSP90 domain protein [Aureimonas frigidaquae]